METPTLHADGGLVLRPISSGDLPDLLESYQESPEDGQTALPWMYPRNVAEQLGDFVRDILRSADEDRIHFWSIDWTTNTWGPSASAMNSNST